MDRRYAACRPDRVAGEYRLTPELVVAVREEKGRLTLSMADHKALPMEPIGGSEFQVKGIAATVSFTLGRDGRASRLTLTRYGERAVAERLADAPRVPAAQEAEPVLNVVESLTPKLMVALNVPGVSIAGISRRRVAWHREFGVRTAGQPDRVDRDTAFEACSMSKTPFAYVVLKLVEERKLDLDRPLVDYLDKPYLPDEPLHRKITARMVLTHTTGFPNWRKGDWHRGGPLPVLFEPGTQFGYSGEGFLYLQRVVEHITGEPLEPLLRKRLFDPLGMTHSSYVWQDRYGTLAAQGHNRQGEPTKDRPLFRDANAAYSLYTTPTEYATFLAEIMRTDRSAAHSLSRASIEAMLTRAVRATDRQPIQRRGGPPQEPVYWGLGWPIDRTASGDRFRCFCQFDPKRGTGIVIMTNGANGDVLWQKLIAAVGEP